LSDNDTTTEVYNLDEPPKNQFLARLVFSGQVNNQEQADGISPFVARAYKFMTSGEYAKSGPAWITDAESVEAIVNELDGTSHPLHHTECLALKDKNGVWVKVGQAPDQLRKAYSALQVSASYLLSPIPAIGRVFLFESGARSNRKFAKNFRLWPVEVREEGFVYTDDVRVITATVREDSGDSPSTPGPVATTTLAEVAVRLDGVPVDGVFKAILDAHLPTQAEGLDILEAAVADGDGSLVSILEARGLVGVVNGAISTREVVPVTA
jgi:hypothetical protein